MWDHWGSDCAGDGQGIMGSLIRHNQDNKLGDKGSAPAQLSTLQPRLLTAYTASLLPTIQCFIGWEQGVDSSAALVNTKWSMNAKAVCNRVFSFSKVIKLGLFSWIVYSVARLSSGLDMFMVALYVNQSQLLCGVCSVSWVQGDEDMPSSSQQAWWGRLWLVDRLRSFLSLADEKLRLHPLLLDCIIEHLFIFMICPWQSRNQDAKHEYNPLTVRSCEFIIIEEVKLRRSH